MKLRLLAPRSRLQFLPTNLSHLTTNQVHRMKLKPRFSIAFLLLLCTVIACSIAGVVWLRSNIIIRSEVPGTLVARDGERYPINSWFHLTKYNPSVFCDDDFTIGDGMKPFSVLETNQGKYRAKIENLSYGGSSDNDFRVELLIKLGERIE